MERWSARRESTIAIESHYSLSVLGPAAKASQSELSLFTKDKKVYLVACCLLVVPAEFSLYSRFSHFSVSTHALHFPYFSLFDFSFIACLPQPAFCYCLAKLAN